MSRLAHTAGNALPFTYVNPAPDTKLSHRDRVFVLTSKIEKELESDDFKGPINFKQNNFKGSIIRPMEPREGGITNMYQNNLGISRNARLRSITKSYINQSRVVAWLLINSPD